MADAIRFVAFTDHHGDLEATHSILELAEREQPDLLLCAGDFSYFGKNWESSWAKLSACGIPLYYVGGNHEDGWISRQAGIGNAATWLSAWKNPALRVINANGRRVQFLGIDGSPEFEPTLGSYKGTADVDLRLVKGSVAANGALPLVVVTHYPPTGTKCCGPLYDSSGSIAVPVKDFEYFVGSERARAFIDALNPVLVITGHHHDRFGVEDRIGRTRVINPGPTGMLLTIDL